MGGWKIMKIRGIPLKIHPSWVLVLLYFTLLAKDQLQTLLDGQVSIWTEWIIGLLTSFFLFLSILLHELAHSFVALGEGIKVREITLFSLGGMVNLENECPTSKGSLKIAISGPIVSLLLAFLMLFLSNIFSDSSLIFSNLFRQVGSLNLLLGVINLLPIIPLDGGVILKSLIWYFTGSKRIGLEVAIKTGRIIACFSISLGVFLLVNGSLYVSLCFLIIGFFILSSSGSQSQIILIQKILSELNVNKVYSRSYRVLEDDLPVRVLSKYSNVNINNTFNNTWVLLCREGRWVGYVNENILKNISVQNWDKKFLYDFSCPLDELPSVGEKESLWKAILIIERTKEARLLVFSNAGLPLGTLDRADIGKGVLQKMGLNPPDYLIKLAKKENMYPLGLNLPKIANSMILSDLEDNKK